MTDKTLSQLIGGDSGIRLAPDLTSIQDRFIPASQFERISGIDVSSGLASIVSGTGKFIIHLLFVESTLVESMTAKLTIDGEVKINSTFTPDATGVSVVGSNMTGAFTEGYIVDQSFDFEFQTTTDTSIDLRFTIRPIK